MSKSIVKSSALCLFVTTVLLSSITFAGNNRIIAVHQNAPDIVHVDVGKEGKAHGDIVVFDADITSNVGLSGKLSGYLLVVDIPNEEHETYQHRLTQLVFDFGHANTIVIGGKSVYFDDGDTQMDKNLPQIRAVIGGTGLFIGARGQVETTRNDDESYTHSIHLVD